MQPIIEMNIEDAKGQAQTAARCLVVYVPGLWSYTKDWDYFKNKLAAESGFGEKDLEWFVYDHKLRGVSRGELENNAVRLRNLIEAEWEEKEGFDEIILVGKSIGGLIVRQAYLIGALEDSPENTADEWTKKVSRIVLYAGINRGLVASRLRWLRLSLRICRLLPVSHMIVQDITFGSVFLTNLRINWIRHFGKLEKEAADETNENPPNIPLVVQILGDEDRLVSREDSTDVLAFQSGIQIEIPEANHRNIVEINGVSDPDAKFALLKKGFLYSPELDPEESHTPEEKPEPEIKRVVFLLHGIRAFSVDDWQEKLTKQILSRDPEQTKVIRPSYGYFSVIRFVITGARNRCARLVQDWYTETLAKYPAAEYSVVAHSNGSYLLGRSLQEIPGIKFKNIVLAGSVLPEDFDWGTLVEREQFTRLRNDRASHDYPVAIMCNILNGFGVRSIGSAGFSGFSGKVVEKIEEVAFYPGGHSVALHESNHPHLVDYIFDTEVISKADDLVSKPAFFTRFSNLSRRSGLLFMAALGFTFASLFIHPILWTVLLSIFFIYILLDVI